MFVRNSGCTTNVSVKSYFSLKLFQDVCTVKSNSTFCAKGFKALVLPKKMYLLKNVSGHVDEFVSSLKTI